MSVRVIPSNPAGVDKLEVPYFVLCWDTDRRLFHSVTIHSSDRQTELWQQYRA